MKDDFYRPAHIEFNVAHDGSNVPEMLGKFETVEDMTKFVHSNLTAMNQRLMISRYLDNKEKRELQEQYSELLENIVPVYEKNLKDAELNLQLAKENLKDAQEWYNSEIAKVKELAGEKKRGLRDMELDDKFTFRVPYNGYYYFFTWIDKELRLCLIRSIPEMEKQDLYNSMAANEEFIDKEYAPKKAKK